MRARAPGFVLPTILVLLSLSALLVADALAGARTTLAVATRLHLREQSFQVAEAGLAAADARLLRQRVVGLTVAGEGESQAVVSSQVDAVESLPPGFSAGRFALEIVRVESVATAPRGTRLSLAAGYARWAGP